MKKYLMLLLFSSFAFAQTYVPDNSFSNDSFVKFLNVYPNSSYDYSSITEIGTNYYCSDYYGMAKVGSDGVLVSRYAYPNQLNDYLIFKNVKYVGDFIYLLGSLETSTIPASILIVKLDLDLNPVAAFGSNGVQLVNLGSTTEITDLVLDNDGNLYCSGTRDTKMILFKLDSTTGALLTTFDPAGYKEYVYHVPGGAGTEKSQSGYIAHYNGNYILAGKNYTPSRLVTIAIDEQGNVLSNYGTNGYQLAAYANVLFSEIKDIKIVGNRLYMNYKYQDGFNAFSANFINYLGTDTVVNIATGYFGGNSINVYDDGLYTTTNAEGSMLAPGSTGSFVIRKYTLDGVVDPTFHIAGFFSQNYDTGRSARSMAKTADGNIVISGSFNTYADPTIPVNYTILGITRIKPGIPLATQTFTDTQFSVYPNPFENKIAISGAEEVTALEVYDLTGRKVTTPTFERQGTMTMVDLSDIRQGAIYMLRIITAKGTAIKKISRN